MFAGFGASEKGDSVDGAAACGGPGQCGQPAELRAWRARKQLVPAPAGPGTTDGGLWATQASEGLSMILTNGPHRWMGKDRRSHCASRRIVGEDDVTARLMTGARRIRAIASRLRRQSQHSQSQGFGSFASK